MFVVDYVFMVLMLMVVALALCPVLLLLGLFTLPRPRRLLVYQYLCLLPLSDSSWPGGEFYRMFPLDLSLLPPSYFSPFLGIDLPTYPLGFGTLILDCQSVVSVVREN